MIARSAEKPRRGSIETARSEVNLTEALSHTTKVGLCELGSSFRNLPRLLADDGQSGSNTVSTDGEALDRFATEGLPCLIHFRTSP